MYGKETIQKYKNTKNSVILISNKSRKHFKPFFLATGLDASLEREQRRIKTVARHLNAPNHFKQHMAACGLSLHHETTESRRTLE